MPSVCTRDARANCVGPGRVSDSTVQRTARLLQQFRRREISSHSFVRRVSSRLSGKIVPELGQLYTRNSHGPEEDREDVAVGSKANRRGPKEAMGRLSQGKEGRQTSASCSEVQIKDRQSVPSNDDTGTRGRQGADGRSVDHGEGSSSIGNAIRHGRGSLWGESDGGSIQSGHLTNVLAGRPWMRLGLDSTLRSTTQGSGAITFSS